MIMMDGRVFLRSSSSRSISASAAERILLLGALATHMGVLDTRENDAQTVLRKSELWDDITRHFNTNTTTPRSRQQIQTLYKNMKAKARRYEARLAEVASGIPPPDHDPISEMLLGLLHQQLRHQQRTLRNLVAGDGNGLSAESPDSDQPSNMQQFSSPFINPEQMMQVSLSEGTADGIDIKSESEQDEFSLEEELNNDTAPPQPTPEVLVTSEAALTSSMSTKSPDSASNYQIYGTSPSLQNMTVPQSSTQNSDDQPLSPSSNTSDLTLGESQNQLPTLTSKLQPSQSTSPFQFGPVDRNLQASPKSTPYQPFASTSDFLTALRNLGSSESTPLRNLTIDRKPGSVSPTPKRSRLESISTNCGTTTMRNLNCCCPEIHTKFLAMAQEEHELKKALLKQDQELREQEHTARMRILALKESEAKLKIEKMQHIFQNGSEEFEIQKKSSIESIDEQDTLDETHDRIENTSYQF